jgi:hypothetical protein
MKMSVRSRLPGTLPALCASIVVVPLSAVAADGGAPAAWSDTVALHGHLEAGITGNADVSQGGLNFGHLLTDRSGQLLANQLLLTAERPLSATPADYELGFKLQAMYGSDARYTHFLGELDHTIHSRTQLDIVEANVLLHTPWLGEGGLDIKAGQFSSPLGAEIIDAEASPLYSHSYIFNFGVPFKHTGVLTTTHVNATLDVHAGLDSGVNTSLGDGDNNGRPAGIVGFGLNGLMDGKLTVLALSHIGPENATLALGPDADAKLRFLNDVVITYKASDALTLTTDINYIREEAFDAEGYGIAQYASYALNDWMTLVGRAEAWRDADGFFVAAVPGNLDYANAQRGLPATVIGGGKTTYGALTLGLTLKPALSGLPVTSIALRPEVRYDRALNGSRPFDGGTAKHQFTVGGDIVIAF